MKKFFEAVMEWKTPACFLYTGSVILTFLIRFLLGYDSVPVSILFSLLVMSALVTLLQFFLFSGRFVRRMRYTARLLIFCVAFLAVLSANAFLFGWLPAGAGDVWLTFTAVFALIFAVMTAGFEVYFRVTGKRYDGLLGQYRKAREEGRQG